MDTRQILRQVRYLAGEATWTGGGAKVFGSVTVSAREPGKGDRERILPALVIQPVDARQSGEHSQWRRLECHLHLIADNAVDPHGETAMLDGARVADTSQGAGLARLCRKLADTFAALTPTDGVDAWARLVGGPAFSPRATPPRATFVLRVGHHDAETFPPASNLQATPGTGEITLAWSLPPDRFDLVGVMVRRDTGSPPATPASGTLVYTGSGTGVVDSGLSGGTPYFYRIWGTFDADVAIGATPVTDTYSDTAPTATATPA